MNELAHLGAGVLIATAFGFRGWRAMGLALFAILPDWDALTTPFLPWAIETFGLGREAARDLLVVAGHGAFSHSALGVGILFAGAFVFGLRGRALACAAAGLLSHWLLDLAVAWDVWLWLPFSNEGRSWGFLDLEDPVVTLAIAGLALAAIAPHAWRWTAARVRREPAPHGEAAPAWLPRALLALAVVLVLVPAIAQPIAVATAGGGDAARAVAVGYATFVVVEPVGDVVKLALVRPFEGVVARNETPLAIDETNGAPGARDALDTMRRALDDMGPTNPFSLAVLTARAEPDGGILVEAREARETLGAPLEEGADEVGLEVLFTRDGLVHEVRITKGGHTVVAPLAVLPVWVPAADES